MIKQVKDYFSYAIKEETDGCKNNTDCPTFFCCASVVLKYPPLKITETQPLACIPSLVADEKPDVDIKDFNVEVICSGATKL